VAGETLLGWARLRKGLGWWGETETETETDRQTERERERKRFITTNTAAM